MNFGKALRNGGASYFCFGLGAWYVAMGREFAVRFISGVRAYTGAYYAYTSTSYDISAKRPTLPAKCGNDDIENLQLETN